MSAPRIGALFAGYGGIELAARTVWPDAEPVWFSELDPAPSRILAHHWPTVPNLGDVTRVDWARVEPVDVITGGSPCQDLSHAGKRAGMKAGTRSGLWASMCDAVDIIRPRLVVWENVRGALSAEATAGDVESCDFCVADSGEPPLRALGRVLGDLAELGYDSAWTGLRAADVGAPHGRWRVFVVAWPQGDGSALTWPQGDGSALLPTPAVNDMGASYTPDEWDEWTARMKAEHANGNGHGPSLHIEALRMLPTTTQRGPDANRDTRAGAGPNVHNALLPTPTAGTQSKSKRAMTASSSNGRRSGGGQSSPLGLDEVTSLMAGERPPHLPADDDLPPASRAIVAALLPTPRATDGTKGGPNQRGSSGDLMLPSAVQLLPTPTATDSKGSGGKVGSADVTLTDATERGAVRGIDFGVYAPAIARWEAVLGRPAPSPTEPTGKGGAQRLSPRFVEFMMGLPDGWVTDVPGITRNHALKALGNGVVPQQAAEGIRWGLGVMATDSRAAA